jgi:hypothetical protein
MRARYQQTLARESAFARAKFNSLLESRAVSAEHVLNVLGRLNAAAVPDNVDTALALSEAPRADTQRYDALRTEQANEQEVRHA